MAFFFVPFSLLKSAGMRVDERGLKITRPQLDPLMIAEAHGHR